ncbi:hypothetical protein [Thermococcus sp.]
MGIIQMWWQISEINRTSLMNIVLDSLKEAIKVTEDELSDGEQDIINPLEIFKNSSDQLLFDIVSFGLSVGDKVLINQPRGFFIDFLEDAAFSVLYARRGTKGIKCLTNLPLEINPYKYMEPVNLVSQDNGIKLFFGAFEPRRPLFLIKKGEKLEISLPGSKETIFVNSQEYAREVEKYVLLGVREVEKIIHDFNILDGLRTKLQWIKAILKYSTGVGL